MLRQKASDDDGQMEKIDIIDMIDGQIDMIDGSIDQIKQINCWIKVYMDE